MSNQPDPDFGPGISQAQASAVNWKTIQPPVKQQSLEEILSANRERSQIPFMSTERKQRAVDDRDIWYITWIAFDRPGSQYGPQHHVHLVGTDEEYYLTLSPSEDRDKLLRSIQALIEQTHEDQGPLVLVQRGKSKFITFDNPWI